MDLRTMNEWRLLQVFLGNRGVYEVYGHMSGKDFTCNCPGFGYRAHCVHTDWVRARMVGDGVYSLNLSAGVRADLDQVHAALYQDPVAFRDWIIKNARVEVIV